MRYIADLHIHSKYSRACSKDLDLEHNRAWALKKGINIVGTGDFTHPAWFKELSQKLAPAAPGLFKLAGSTDDVLFMITTELSCIYKQGDAVRRIHLCVFAPDLETVAKRIGNVRGLWAFYVPIEFVLASSAIFEILEMIAALVYGGDLGIAYLGTQGDVWDPIMDMTVAGVGSILVMFIVMLVIVYYDRKGFWKEFKESLSVKQTTVLGEKALSELELKKKRKGKRGD